MHNKLNIHAYYPMTDGCALRYQELTFESRQTQKQLSRLQSNSYYRTEPRTLKCKLKSLPCVKSERRNSRNQSGTTEIPHEN